MSSAFLPFAGFVLARQILTDEASVKTLLWFLAIFGIYLALTNILWLTGPKRSSGRRTSSTSRSVRTSAGLAGSSSTRRSPGTR